MTTQQRRHVTPDEGIAYVWSAFHVTGIDCSGRRFKRVFPATEAGYMMAQSINVYRGTLWGVRHGGKRSELRRYFN